MDKINPLVSVIVPLYNYEKYIKDCVRSIQAQTYRNWEAIIIDDHSTDRSYKIARKIAGPRVRVIQTDKNSGYSKAKNFGIRESKGELITCLDADDLFTRISLEHRVNVLKKTGADFIHANAITVKGDISLEDCYKLRKFTRQTPMVHAQTVMMYRWVHKKFGLYDENLRSRADKEMWIRLFGNKLAGPHLIKKAFTKKDVAYYRRHKASMMSMRRRNPKYNNEVTKKLQQAIKMRRKEGITKDNTLFLER